jgi:hemoglobin
VVGDERPGQPPTLYAWAGGREAFERLIDAFYDHVEHDDVLSPLFPGGVSVQHRDNVTTWWCEVFGGPARYTEEFGGYERMVGKHRGLAITGGQRLRFVSLMSLAADDAGLPGDPEFRSAFVAYLEWGTRLAMGNSRPGADVIEHAPVPRGDGARRRPSSRRRPPGAGPIEPCTRARGLTL